MPHYKDPQGHIHWLDDPRFAGILPQGSVPITDEEAAAVPPPPEDIRVVALGLLQETDLVATRCFKAGIAYPESWKAYTSELRLVINGDSDTLPVKPDFPDEADPYEPPIK